MLLEIHGWAEMYDLDIPRIILERVPSVATIGIGTGYRQNDIFVVIMVGMIGIINKLNVKML